MIKAVILIGGPQKGTRFRPLSLDVPKPLFPVAGFPIIQHHIEACSQVPNLKEVLLIGFYQPSEVLSRFIVQAQQEFKVSIRYLQEYTGLGTAGGLYHFRDQIVAGGPRAFFVLNGDVCADFPLVAMLSARDVATQSFTVMCTNANRKQSLNYGCIVENSKTHEVLHYVEKPSTFVSKLINCGVYLFCPEIFQHIATVFQQNQQELLRYSGFILSSKDTLLSRFIGLLSKLPRVPCDELASYPGEDVANGTSWARAEVVRLEQDVFTALAGQGSLYTFHTDGFWSQIKSAGSAIYANRLYLGSYHNTHPERLAENGPGKPKVIGDVYIHPTASVDPTAVLGPNVTVGTDVAIGPGVRVRESIILQGSTLQDHCCVLNSIVGWDSMVGRWARVEGTPSDPNPNDPFAKMDSESLFNTDGRLNPSITILGCNVSIPAEVVILNSIVLPHKELQHSFKNQIIL